MARSVVRISTVPLDVWRLTTLIYAAFMITGTHAAQAGINVWTSHGAVGGSDQILELAIDPVTPSILYAGTIPLHCTGTARDRVFKSTDGGVTWTATGPTTGSDINFNALAIDPRRPDTLYAGIYATCGGREGGVLKTTDGGATWHITRLHAAGAYVEAVVTLAIDPTTSSTVYAGAAPFCLNQICDSPNGVFKSTDDGATWSTTAALGGDRDPRANTSALAIDPTQPATVYAATFGDIFKSTDGGGAWNATGLVPTDSFGYTIISALVIDPAAPDTLYASVLPFWDLSGIYKSTDGGTTWHATNTGLPDNTNVTALVIDQTEPSVLYAGTNRGVFKSTDGGATWGSVNTGLTNSSVHALAIDAVPPATLYAGTDEGRVFSIQEIATCVGNCEGTGTVAVNDLITLVSIALGTAQPAACANGGLPIGGDVTVAVIIEAVNHALSGCSGTAPKAP